MEAKSRSLEDIKNDIARRAGRVNPFERVDRQEVEGLLGRLTSLDPDLWGSEWGKLGARHEANAEELAKLGKKEAGEAYYQAYEYYRIGRYPVPSSAEKMNCYKGALRSFLKAAPYLDPPLERIEIPFEGKKVVGYLQIPRGANRPPVVMHWGGVDGWKEDRRSNSEVFHKEGLATFTIDMPGAGENPCLGQEPRADRTFSAAIDYLETRNDIDGKRIAVYGRELRRILGGEARAHGTKAIAWRCELGRRRPPDVPRRMAATRADPDGVSISHGTRKPVGCAVIYLRRENLGRGSQDCSESIIGDPRDH